MERRRARSDDDKRARLATILDAARRRFDSSELEGFTMDAVAADLGLAKGTLYRYVPTREALLLALTRAEYERWFDDVDARLADRRRDVARTLVDATLAEPRFARLVGLLATVLERNVPADTAHAFKAALVERSGRTASLLAERLGTDVGSAVQLLIHLNAALVGLHAHAHPAPVVAEVLRDPALAPMRVDLRAELTHAVGALVAAARPGGTR